MLSPLGNLLDGVGLLAGWGLKRKRLPFFLAHECRAERRNMRELLLAHVGLLAPDYRVLVRVPYSVFADSDFRAESYDIFLLALSRYLRVLYQILKPLNALLGRCLEVSRFLILSVFRKVAQGAG